MRLTFVCSGNTCRSPLALAAWDVVTREVSAECREKLAQITVESAGLNARAGAAATPMAQLLAASWDADLSEHYSRVWRPQTRHRKGRRDEAQLIVAMTGEQAAQVQFQLEMRPDTGEVAVEVLGAFVANSKRLSAPSWSEAPGEIAGAALDIPDPYGGSSEAYEECAARVLRAVRALARTLCRD